MARTAVVGFEGDADRRIAGIPWAARVARELCEAGFDRAAMPPLGPRTLDEIARLAPNLEIASAGACEGEPIVARAPSEADILRSTGKAGDGPVSRHLNRPVSRAISRLLLRLPFIRPHHATLFSAGVALLMLWALLSPGGLLIGALLFHAASILDGVDGEIARATFRSSRAGAILDSIVDVATTLIFLAGLTLHLGRAGHAEAYPIAAWGIGLFLIGLAVILRHSARTHGPFNFNHLKRHYRDRASGPILPPLIRALTIFSSRDFYALFLGGLIVIGIPIAALYVFALAATVWIVFVLGSLGRASPSAAPDLLSKA